MGGLRSPPAWAVGSSWLATLRLTSFPEFINDASDSCFTAASRGDPALCFSSRVDDS